MLSPKTSIKSDFSTQFASMKRKLETLERSFLTPSSIVTELPENPLDGQEVYYLADSESGVVWHFRYRESSESIYKWEFVGGSALFNEVFTGESTSSLTFADLGTVGPSISISLAGDYDAEFGGRIIQETSGGAVIGIKVGSAEAGNGAFLSGGGFSFPAANVFRALRLQSLKVEEVIKLQYHVSEHKAEFVQRFLYMRPVRVG